MKSKSEEIRSLARAGTPVAEIARMIGIRYQHAYKVCRDAGLQPSKPVRTLPGVQPQVEKPTLLVDAIVCRGFKPAGCWLVEEARLACSGDLPKERGVYAFSTEGKVLYVGVASRSLAQRFYFYGRPGKGQRTNIRLNELIRESIHRGKAVDVHYACPPSLDWNGFTISGPEGLEAGLIQQFLLPWNQRGAS